MLRYLLKTLLQINLFADSLNGENSNSTDLYNQNSTFSAFDDIVIDFGNLTNFNGSRPHLEDSPPRLVEHPSDLIVSKGEPATLNCKAEGRPNPIIEWYKDGERVETDKEDPHSHRMLLPSGSLFFLRIVHGRRSKPDEGIYICVARNYLGEAISRNASLEVAILRDDFRQTPSDVVVVAGEPAVMECIPPRGHPEPTISWKKNNIRISDKDERITIRGGKLMMSHTKKNDAGMYICMATNMVGERDSEPAELVVFERPSFVKRPTNQVVLAEDTVNFHCEVAGDPLPTVRWQKEDGELPQGRYEIRNDNTLWLKHVCAEDEGTYTCITENSVGKSEASGSLSVHVPPQLVTPPRNQIVTQGRTVIFHCETKGNPPPAVFWQKEGSQSLLFPSQPPQPTGHFSVSSNGELTITEVQSGDAGYYMCQAISVAGSILAKALLEVEDASFDHIPPIIRRGPNNQTVPKDSAVQLQCQVTGNPFPSIQWLKDGQRIVGSDTRVGMLDNGTLQITNLQVTDSGSYLCVATSSTGETTWSGYLKVKESGDPIHVQISEPNFLPASPSKPIVTHVTKNSVTLTWQPNPVSGTTAVTSYIIEAFSQSTGNTWQTVADNVKVKKYTVIGLNPNTIYLFIIRGVNMHGRSDPSPISEPVRTQDISPTRQGVDLRQVQSELGEVMAQLRTPVLLNSSAIQVTWTVDRQSQFIQGYRVMYHNKAGAWQVQDVKSPSERSTILTELKKDTEYEIKIRPYFDEFQGRDSELLGVRTSEEVPIGPPQVISVVMLGLNNSTDISVSWKPPLVEIQNGIIQEYRIWCSGNETHFHVNQTVDGAIHSTIIKDLVPGMLYRIEVAAATSAGVGVKSQPVTVQIEHPMEQNLFTVNNGEKISFAEQITDVVKQPACIAGTGGACWVILMCISMWIYCRRKKRKELSHYTATFSYSPAVSFPHRDGQSSINGRPGMIATSPSNYHWLADSWPATNLILNGKPKDTAVNFCTENHGATERYYDDAGISTYIAQTETFTTTATDGPIYSTIDPTSDEIQTFNGAFSPNTPLHATIPVIPYGARILQSPEIEVNQWNDQPGPSRAQDAHPERGRTENVTKIVKQKALRKTFKTPLLNWTENLPQPPPANEPSLYQGDDEYNDELETASDSEKWCPPLPERTYLMENIQEEDSPPLPSCVGASSPANSYGKQSTATLTPSPRGEIQASEEIPRLHQFDIPFLSRRLATGLVPLQRVQSPPLTQSNPNLHALKDGTEGNTPRHGNRRNLSQTSALSADNVSSPGSGKTRHVLSENMHSSPGQMSKAKKKSKSGYYRREGKREDLPPPPEPPPGDGTGSSSHINGRMLDCCATSFERYTGTLPSAERRMSHEHSQQTVTGVHNQHREEEEIIPYSKPNFVSRGQLSSNCSTEESSSSRGSTSSRSHGSERSTRAGDRGEEKR